MQLIQRLTYILVAIFSITSCQQQDQRSLVRAPFTNISLPVVSTTFDIALGDTLFLENGSIIEIPAYAFIKPDGSPAEGEITFTYRDMHNVEDIIISGIPLNSVKENKMEALKSAVMWEMRAYQDSMALELDTANHKTIKTIIASNVAGPEYDLYYLDEEESSWDVLQSVVPEENPRLILAKERIIEAETEITSRNIKNCFALNYVDFIDIGGNQKMPPRDGIFDYYRWGERTDETIRGLMKGKLNSYGTSWIDAINKYDKVYHRGTSYPASLILWETEDEIPLWINNDKVDIEASVKKIRNDKYKISFSKYFKTDSGWEFRSFHSLTAQIKMPLRDLYKSKPKAWTEEYTSFINIAGKEKEIAESQKLVLRSIEVTKMGIYNYDTPFDTESFIVDARFEFDNQKKNSPIMDVFVLPIGFNAVVRYSNRYLDRFTIYRNSDMVAFAVFDGNKIAVVEPKTFSEVDYRSLKNIEKPEVTFTLKETDYIINNADDLEVFLDTYRSKNDQISLLK